MSSGGESEPESSLASTGSHADNHDPDESPDLNIADEPDDTSDAESQPLILQDDVVRHIDECIDSVVDRFRGRFVGADCQ